jgi:hypothetical protein
MSILRNILILCATILMVLFSGCSDKGVTPQKHTSTFPLTVGSRWQYYRIVQEVPFNDSANTFTDSTLIVRRIIPQDSLGMILQCQTMDDTLMPLGVEGDYSVDRQWIDLRDGKLVILGEQMRYPDTSYDPSIYSPPVISLDFPLDEGKIWVPNGDLPGTITWQVLGSEVLLVLGQSFECDIVGTQFDYTPNSPDPFPLKEWYSNDGLIKENYSFLEYIRNEYGNIIDSAHYSERWELNDINIVRPD